MSAHSKRRTPAWVAIAGASALVLAGCTGGGESTDGTEAPAAEGDFAGQTLNVMAAWSGAEQANFEAVLDKFEEDTGATVNYTSFGDNGPTVIQGQIEGGTPPN